MHEALQKTIQKRFAIHKALLKGKVEQRTRHYIVQKMLPCHGKREYRQLAQDDSVKYQQTPS